MRDANPSEGLGAVALHLLFEVQVPDRGAGREGGFVEEISWHDPCDFELDAVGVLCVQALGGAVVARTDERPGLTEAGRDLAELAQGVHFPSEVVEAHGLLARR